MSWGQGPAGNGSHKRRKLMMRRRILEVQAGRREAEFLRYSVLRVTKSEQTGHIPTSRTGRSYGGVPTRYQHLPRLAAGRTLFGNRNSAARTKFLYKW